ncbi:hypothetical protein GCM10025857_15160 [Alicyclobacillus contaminans]|uniref:hypothetical protein n=1 Tax=Alicyclobacillus contaminans TaxID=392016 RepID=UPI00047A5FDE|nr:hypothetical protein [Alicyclobacillus contaminans]GMA50159.1 hypothetical protein GCM10025857_15160 [Alicyclobacillus contaminans]
MNVTPGCKVRWESHGAGWWTTKEGEVVDVVTEFDSAFRLLPDGLPRSRRKFDTDRAMVGKRVLVKVPRISKKDGSVLGYDYYCPWLSVVTVVEEAMEKA